MDKQNMKKIYNKLNGYLNEICNYLEQNNSFLLDNIAFLSVINNQLLIFLRNSYNLDNQVVQNHLTFEDVYLLAREIIESIDPNYLPDFDNLIKTGELNFIYNSDGASSCRFTDDGHSQKRLITIYRHFNYDDVVTLIHEFIHYTNIAIISKQAPYLNEFLPTYFEYYTIDYLLKKGINKEEIDYLDTLKAMKQHTSFFSFYNDILLAYVNFGNINENTIDDLHKYISNIKKENWDKLCTIFCYSLGTIEKEYQTYIERKPEMLGQILSSEFIIYDYKYIWGAILAFLARKYSNLEDIVYLNNHFSDYNGLDIIDIGQSIGIDLTNPNLINNVLDSITDYLEEKKVKKKK